MAGRLDAALSDAAAEQEVRAALESVFPFSMLGQFVTASRSDKEAQLQELPNIVLGICLYNQARGLIAGHVLSAALLQSPSDLSTQHARCLAELDAATASLKTFAGALWAACVPLASVAANGCADYLSHISAQFPCFCLWF